MLINLISTGNYNSYNIELAKILGLHEAIYLNELININEKAIRKDKVIDDFFIVDREYIRCRTTISPEEQKEIDKELQICNIVEVGKEKDSLKINFSKLTTMLMEGNEGILKGFVREVKDKKKVSKAEIIRQQLKNNIKTDNQELRDAYCEWIDSVSMKRGYMAKKAVLEGQTVIDNYCNRNLDMALKIISIATVHSYVDMNWALNDFKKDYASTFNRVPVIQNVQQLSTEVF